MNGHGLFAILYTVIYVFDICDSQCDEYIILFQEYSCGKIYYLKPTKINEIIWERLTYPYNTTEVCEEIQGYRECILEFDCVGNIGSCFDIIVPTNHSTHKDIPNNKTIEHYGDETKKLEKPTKIIEIKKAIETVSGDVDNSKMDINIMYINENYTNTMFTGTKNLIQCEYAEMICINEQLNNISISNTEHNNPLPHETPRTLLNITLLRDLNTTIQPIFTGYFPQSLRDLKSTKDYLNDLKMVTFTCELIENDNCRQNVSKKSNNQINVYLKTNYIQNITVKYPNCTKDFDTNDLINLKCDSENFARNNQHLFLTSRFISEDILESSNKTSQEILLMGVKDLLICKCQITNDLNINDSNVISFNNCSNYRNIINEIKSRGLNVTPTVVNKIRNINNKPTTNTQKLKKTENFIQNTLQSNNLSSINEDNIITIRITENGYNCSHELLHSIDVGKIILNNGLEESNIKRKILENKNVVLNISKCININASVLKNTETKTELAIVLKNSSSNSSQWFATDPKEADLKQKVILQCNGPIFNTNSSNANINKTILECESILEDIHNITVMENNTQKQYTTEKSITKPTEKYLIEPKIKPEEPIETNRTFNETDAQDEHNYANNTRNDNSTTSIHNKELGNDTVRKGNPQMNTFNRKKDMKKSWEQNNLGPESSGPEKILIITLCSVAGACLLVIFALQRCTKKGSYYPTPTREAQDEEDTAL